MTRPVPQEASSKEVSRRHSSSRRSARCRPRATTSFTSSDLQELDTTFPWHRGELSQLPEVCVPPLVPSKRRRMLHCGEVRVRPRGHGHCGHTSASTSAHQHTGASSKIIQNFIDFISRLHLSALPHTTYM